MADEVGKAVISVQFDDASVAALEIKASAIGKSVGDKLSQSTDSNRIRRGLKDGEAALIDFGKIGDSVAKRFKTSWGGRGGVFGVVGSAADGFTGLVSKAVKSVFDLGGIVQSGAQRFGQFVSTIGNGAGVLGSLGNTLGSLAPLLGSTATAALGLGIALSILPAAAAAVTFAFVALLDIGTTVAAMFAGFVAPLSVVAGLLGGLGAAFAYVASNVIKTNVSADTQHQLLLKLHVAQQTVSPAAVRELLAPVEAAP